MAEVKINILLAEDDVSLGPLLKEYLEAKGYQVGLAEDGEKASQMFFKHNYDLAILDVMMPQKDGFTLAKEIRKANPHIPIVFLTAKSMKEDTLEGFKSGADDYITKPFDMEELLARVQAVLRRSNKSLVQDENMKVFKIGNFTLDSEKQILTINDKQIRLTSKENQLLRMLCIHKNQILDRTFALRSIWNDDNYFNGRSMDVYVAKIRKYLKEDPNVEIINIHGKGFKLHVKE
ncbi:MAG: response regulator transcription factor [Bacteroidia bacterium]|nr:response regulator transcription factor [Bacteroidia bacterium]